MCPPLQGYGGGGEVEAPPRGPRCVATPLKGRSAPVSTRALKLLLPEASGSQLRDLLLECQPHRYPVHLPRCLTVQP